MEKHIKVVSQLSKVVKLGIRGQIMEPMYVPREKGGNILNCDDFSNIYDVVKSLNC